MGTLANQVARRTLHFCIENDTRLYCFVMGDSMCERTKSDEAVQTRFLAASTRLACAIAFRKALSSFSAFSRFRQIIHESRSRLCHGFQPLPWIIQLPQLPRCRLTRQEHIRTWDIVSSALDGAIPTDSGPIATWLGSAHYSSLPSRHEATESGALSYIGHACCKSL